MIGQRKSQKEKDQPQAPACSRVVGGSGGRGGAFACCGASAGCARGAGGAGRGARGSRGGGSGGCSGRSGGAGSSSAGSRFGGLAAAFAGPRCRGGRGSRCSCSSSSSSSTARCGAAAARSLSGLFVRGLGLLSLVLILVVSVCILLVLVGKGQGSPHRDGGLGSGGRRGATQERLLAAAAQRGYNLQQRRRDCVWVGGGWVGGVRRGGGGVGRGGRGRARQGCHSQAERRALTRVVRVEDNAAHHLLDIANQVSKGRILRQAPADGGPGRVVEWRNGLDGNRCHCSRGAHRLVMSWRHCGQTFCDVRCC